MRIEVELGTTVERNALATPAVIDIEELLATRLLVQGNSGSGKSHLLRRLLEQSAPHVQQLIIDPEGDFMSLSDRYGHIVVEANRSERELEAIALRIREHRASCVLNLDSLEVDMQMKAAAVFLNAFFDAPREFWYPVLVVVDEAQLFAPAAAGEVSDEARRISLGAMTNLMCRGRKRGLAGVIATQRLAKLAKNVAAEASNFLMGRTFLDIDMARAADLLGLDRARAEMFRDLGRGTFVALGPALTRKPIAIKIGPVETAPRAAAPKLMPLPDPSDGEMRDMILAPLEAAAPRAQRRAQPRPEQSTEALLEAASREPDAAATDETREALPSLTAAERDALLQDIASQVMADPEAPYRPEGVLYQDFLVHCRMRRVPAPRPDLDTFRRYLTVARAGTIGDLAENPDWVRAMEVSVEVPEDLRGLYLLFARSAIDAKPCPSDHDAARACGTHSPSRARSRVTMLEQNAFITIRKDMRGNRIIALPDIGRETAPGDPTAPAREEVG